MQKVAPLVGAWIETLPYGGLQNTFSSLPSWERGLKQELESKFRTMDYRSLPSWERGLKHRGGKTALRWIAVAPLVGAWIETGSLSAATGTFAGRSPRGSVD